MPIVTTYGINVSGRISLYARGTKDLYYRHAVRVNDVGAGVMDAIPSGFPIIRPNLYYGVSFVGYKVYEYLK